MDEPKSLDSLFKQKIFRIPDYQRGFAWQQEHFKDFWEDLVNLSDGRSHYTGVITLRQVPTNEINETDKEYWLIEDHSYNLYHIVDGQQRLTTFIMFLQSFVEFIKCLPENSQKSDDEIYITGTLIISDIQSDYLFMVKPTGDRFRTYKFGYTADNPSYDYLRYRILNEAGAGDVQETFYTLNLSNAILYFTAQLKDLYKKSGLKGLEEIYRRLTRRFLLNEYVINDDFDVFVAFETMNNRGKKLSDLELLKNRLIYLTTLYDDKELDPAERRSLRDSVNDAWKEVYHQLGRNKSRPLSDDEYLRAHWTMFFSYSRQTGKDYIRFLLGEHFTTKRVHKEVGLEVNELEDPEEQLTETDIDDSENEDGDAVEETAHELQNRLKPTDISDFVISLKESAVHWFNSYHPNQADNMSTAEKQAINRLNRVGMTYFRPLVMAVLKKEPDEVRRIDLFQHIERFIFLAFRMGAARSNYGSSEFFNVVRKVDRGEANVADIKKMLGERLSFTFNPDKTLRIDDFHNLLQKKFESGHHGGYYEWFGLRYFLYEYELSLLSETRQVKLDWSDLLKTQKDKISIEHIYPQTPTGEWETAFEHVDSNHRPYYGATLGNLLILSASINSSLQNDSFDSKKKAQFDSAGQKTRNGYSDGSHSEIEVAHETNWGPRQINKRGIRLLSFMENRWDFKFGDSDKKKLLFLPFDERLETV